MKKRIIIKEEDYNTEWKEWEKTVIITCWEHDFEEKCYIIDYMDK